MMINNYAGEKFALRKLDEIEKTIWNLSKTPHVGSIRDEVYPGLRAIPTARKGVIAFMVDDNKKQVLIISVAYAGGNWTNWINNRMFYA